jgi:hypothetical protein
MMGATLPTLLSAALCVGTPRALDAQTLRNAHIEARFGPAGLTSVTTRSADGVAALPLRADHFAVRLVDGGDTVRLDSRSLTAPTRRVTTDSVIYRFRSGRVTVEVLYHLARDWHWVSKQLRVTSAGDYRVADVTVLREVPTESPIGLYAPPSARPSLGTRDYGAAVRFARNVSALMLVQNPFLESTRQGDTITVRYAPDMAWRASYGPFESDRAFIAPLVRSGRVLPARMAPEWVAASAVTDTAAGMDEAEVRTFTAMVRAAMLYEPRTPLHVFVGWTANDYQIDVGTEQGRSEYTRLFDQAAAVGARYVLYAPSNSVLARREASVDDWSWEHVLWLGLGQQIRRGEWNPRTDAVPSTVAEMVKRAADRKLGLLAYVYPVLPFSQQREWLVPARANSTKQVASLGNRALQDWLIDEMVAFHARTGIAGFAFDHTFLTYDGTSRYAQWWGWRRVMEGLRRRIPDVVIDGRQAYHLYGPWSWLAGSYPHPTFHDEQPESFTPYPDLHFDRVSANRERYTAYRYRNYEFTPSELVPGYMTHQTSRSDGTNDMPFTRTPDRGVVLTSFRARDHDLLGWRYSVLSSIAVGGWNNVIDFLPARDSAEFAHFSSQDRAWLRRWLTFTERHKELLRHTRTILGQPSLGAIDGTAAIDGDHGFVFLFNPDARRLSARVALDASIGLSRGTRFVVREVYPQEGRVVAAGDSGYVRRGDSVTVALDGGSALVLEVIPAPATVSTPVLFGARGAAALHGDSLALTDVAGEVGQSLALSVLLPAGRAARVVTVNGVRHTPATRGNVVRVNVRVAGTAFGAMHPVIAWDSTNTGGRVSGTLTIPRHVFAQLQRRRASWPIPWTSEDYETTWLAPERLLLWAPLSQPDDRWNARLFIDGRQVELRKAYTAVRVVRSTFVGFYADISLLEPDRPYRIELELPTLARGQFRGLYVENVEPEWSTVIAPPR